MNLLGNSGGLSEPAGLDLAPDEQLLPLVPGGVGNTAAALVRGLCIPWYRGVKCKRGTHEGLFIVGDSPVCL